MGIDAKANRRLRPTRAASCRRSPARRPRR